MYTPVLLYKMGFKGVKTTVYRPVFMLIIPICGNGCVLVKFKNWRVHSRNSRMKRLRVDQSTWFYFVITYLETKPQMYSPSDQRFVHILQAALEVSIGTKNILYLVPLDAELVRRQSEIQDNIIWAVPCKNKSSSICGQRRPRSAWTSAQSDQGFCFPLGPLLSTNKIIGHYIMYQWRANIQGPVVQSIISLTSSLVVRILTVLVSTISNSQVFLQKKCE